MGMGMSVSPQIWQQFVDLAFQNDLIKHKQNFDVIMDDTFIHSTVYLFSPPRQIVWDEATEFTSAIVQAILTILNF